MVMVGKGWHGEPYRHSLAAKGVSTKLMRANLIDGNIYQKVNVLKSGIDGNRFISASLKKHPDLWERSYRVLDDAQTIVALKGSSTGDIYPGMDPDDIVGYIRYRRRYGKDGRHLGYELGYLEVRKDWQGKGIGYAMLGTFFDRVVEYDLTVFVAYGSSEGKIFFDKFYNDPTIRNELWERDIAVMIEE